MFIRNTGLTKVMYFPKTASTAIAAGAAVKLSSGQLVPSVSSDTTILGVSLRAVVSTDADYALTTFIPVEVPVEKAVEWIVDVENNGTATAANVGLAYDLQDSLGINLSGTSNKPVTVTRFISATKVAVTFAAVLV